jgi:hypothetical protein
MHLNDFYEFGSIEPISKKYRNIEKIRFGSVWFGSIFQESSRVYNDVYNKLHLILNNLNLLKKFVCALIKSFKFVPLISERVIINLHLDLINSIDFIEEISKIKVKFFRRTHSEICDFYYSKYILQYLILCYSTKIH